MMRQNRRLGARASVAAILGLAMIAAACSPPGQDPEDPAVDDIDDIDDIEGGRVHRA